MTKSLLRGKPKIDPDIELVPDAWARFERLVEAAAKIGPKHRVAPKPRNRKAKSNDRTKARIRRTQADGV